MRFVIVRSEFSYNAEFPRRFHEAVAEYAEKIRGLRLSPRRHLRYMIAQAKAAYDPIRREYYCPGMVWIVAISETAFRRIEAKNPEAFEDIYKFFTEEGLFLTEEGLRRYLQKIR